MGHLYDEDLFKEHRQVKTGAAALCDSFISMLMRHDPQRADVSTNAEGIFQSVEAFATSGLVSKGMDVRLVNAIISCCQAYNQFELVGKTKKPWPTNRYALSAIRALGFDKPS